MRSPEHFRRAYAYVDEVSRDLAQGRGKKKAEREDLERRVNAALTALRSAAYHEETLGRELARELERRPVQ